MYIVTINIDVYVFDNVCPLLVVLPLGGDVSVCVGG